MVRVMSDVAVSFFHFRRKGIEREPHESSLYLHMYRARNKGMQILLSNSQAGPGTTVKQEQKETSRNHVQAFIPGSVQGDQHTAQSE